MFRLVWSICLIPVQTIPTNLKIDLAAMFHKNIKLSHMLIDYKVFDLISYVLMNVCNVMF